MNYWHIDWSTFERVEGKPVWSAGGIPLLKATLQPEEKVPTVPYTGPSLVSLMEEQFRFRCWTVQSEYTVLKYKFRAYVSEYLTDDNIKDMLMLEDGLLSLKGVHSNQATATYFCQIVSRWHIDGD